MADMVRILRSDLEFLLKVSACYAPYPPADDIREVTERTLAALETAPVADPYVREIGRVEIPGEPPVVVDINHGAVDIGRPALAIEGRLTVMQADQLAALLITACWMASAHPCPADCGEPVHDRHCTPQPEGTVR